MKIAILADAIVNKGGVERMIWLCAKHWDADVYTCLYNPTATFEELKTCKIHLLRTSKKHSAIGSLLSRRAFLKLRLKEKKYDLYISFGGASLEALKHHHPNIWYCNSAVRYLYDFYNDELSKRNFFKRQLFRLATTYLRMRDQKAVRNADRIITNSANVRGRIEKFYKRYDSIIIYPPVETSKFQWRTNGDFYLSTGRIDPIKRVDLAVKAFKDLPDKKLIVASTGPDFERVKKIAENAKNIIFTGAVSEQRLAELYGTCIATIYMSKQEDFGLVPVESMSAGKPCIATNEGGFKETILHEKTGLLIKPEIPEIQKAVEWMTSLHATGMRRACEQRAKIFDVKEFFKKMDDSIRKLLANKM